MISKKNSIQLMIILIILVGCTAIGNKESDIISNSFNDYITITCTGYNNGKNNEDGMTTQIWCFDPASGMSEQIYDFNTSAQYSLGYYDKKNEDVYYVKRVFKGDNYGDELFQLNLETGQEIQLTEGIFAINHIIPLEDRIFIVACKKGERADKLSYIDKKTNKLVWWEEDKDYCVRSIAINKSNKSIYISAYSMAERDESVRKQKDGDFEMPMHTIYEIEYELNNWKKIFSEKWDIRSLMTSNNKITALCEEEYNNFNDDTIMVNVNLETKEITMDTWIGPRVSNNNPDYSSDGQFIYGISIVEGKRGLVKYNIKTKRMKMCLETHKSSFINNIFVVKY